MYNGKISIVVAIYNVEKYVAECIESLIQQTYHKLEIILVDDGSTDSSGRICDEYQLKDERIRVIHQDNKGLLMARYIGLEKANCEYVTFVDGDDWIDLNTYEIVAEYLDNFDIVAFGSKLYNNLSNVTPDVSSIPKREYDREQIEKFVIPNMIWNIEKKIYGLNPSVCMKVMRRELAWNSVERVKQLNIYYGEDAVITYPMVKEAESLLVLDKNFYYHRQRERGVLPPYISDNEFLSKLWKFYSFMKEQFINEPECLKQIDYLYIYAVNFRKRIYGDFTYNDKYMFPFAAVSRNSNIVLYGAGAVGQTYYDQIRRSKYCNVIAWVDKNYLKYRNNGLTNVDDVVVIDGMTFDYIVISVLSPYVVEQIKNTLVASGIDEERIVWDKGV